MREVLSDVLTAVSVAALLGVSFDAQAAESPWTSANRIVISADGNPDADADDVGATPFTLAVLAKAGLAKIWCITILITSSNINQFRQHKIDFG